MKRIFLCSVIGISFLFSGCEKEQIKGTITDVDGNIYETIRIGEQWWTVENLKTTHFNDGSVIALIISDTEDPFVVCVIEKRLYNEVFG